VDPEAELLDLPKEYGTPKAVLEWSVVRQKLEAAQVYWLATTRPDGRPHVVPRDGIWVDDALFYGGAEQTVHHRNVRANRNVVATVGEGLEAVIVEGEVPADPRIEPELAARLAAAQSAKYPQYGKATAKQFLSPGALMVRPRRVIAWTQYPANATRFRFS
jgi:hypothetical protein